PRLAHGPARTPAGPGERLMAPSAPARVAHEQAQLQDGGAPSDAVLAAALAQAGVGAPIEIRRRPSRLASSFPLEELRVALRGGGELRLAFKRLHPAALSPSARLAKPGFL